MGAFHEGELALQERTGTRDRLAEAGARFLRDHMPEQHREFFGLLPWLLAGSLDAAGQPWASALCGPPGFVHSPDARLLEVNARPAAHDPLSGNLRVAAPIGLLGIQPHTRRRNRLNGHVVALSGDRWCVRVDQSFGNCPKYIQARQPAFVRRAAPRDVREMPRLDDGARRLVRAADTFFIATAHPEAQRSASAEHGVDVSHRGGHPGFVRTDDDGATLLFPDFTGNSYFNTLGNLLLEPRCGLLFIDFSSGDTLQVAGRATVIGAGPELTSFRGALRLVRVQMTRALWAGRALPLRWSDAQPSPFLAATGRW